jgi:hypothetical protein
MPKYSAKQRKMRGAGKTGGPTFIQLPHYVKRSTAYHGLSVYARAVLVELIDRYHGNNNGMIVLGVREIKYELRCSDGTACSAMRELDDAGLARPLTPGAWRGKQASEWRLMWRRCDKTGDLPRTQWEPLRPPYTPPKPGPKRKTFTNAERQQRYRDRRRANRNENRNDEFTWDSTKVHVGQHRRYSSSRGTAQNGNSSMNVTNSSSPRKAHVHIYQREERYADADLELPECLDRRPTKPK